MNQLCKNRIKTIKHQHAKELKHMENTYKKKLTKHTAGEIIKYEKKRKLLQNEFNQKAKTFDSKIQNKITGLKRVNINRNRNLKNKLKNVTELETRIKTKGNHLKSKEDELQRVKEVLRIKTETDKRRRFALYNIRNKLPRNVDTDVRMRINYLLQEYQSR